MSKNDKGFTLVELIVVIVILAILIGVTIGGIYMYVGQSRTNIDVGNANSLTGVLSSLAVNDDVYSYATDHDLNVIITWSKKVDNSDLSTKLKASKLGDCEQMINYMCSVLTNGLPESQTGKGFDLQIKLEKGKNPLIYVNCIAESAGGITDDSITDDSIINLD